MFLAPVPQKRRRGRRSLGQPAASSRGAPEVCKTSHDRAALLLATFIERPHDGDNSAKILETGDFTKPLVFSDLVRLFGRDTREFLGSSTGPVDSDAIDQIGFADAKGQRAFGLRQIARAAAND